MILVQEKFLQKQLPSHSFSSLFTPTFILLSSAFIFIYIPNVFFHGLVETPNMDFSILFDQGLAYQGVLQGSYTTYTMYNFPQP